MADFLLWIYTAQREVRLGAAPTSQMWARTVRGCRERGLIVYDFRSGTGGNHLTDAGREAAESIMRLRGLT